MDFTIHKPTFFKNLKFWSFHTAINAIPSFCIAYGHDWDTVSNMIAMCIGIILFALTWSYFISLQDIDRFSRSPLISSAIKAGVYLRLFLIILSSPMIVCYLIYVFSGEENMTSVAQASAMLWAGDFVIGIISHEFYSAFRSLTPLRGIHNFLPTIIITLVQGFLLMSAMILAGIVLSFIEIGIKTHRGQRRTTQI